MSDHDESKALAFSCNCKGQVISILPFFSPIDSNPASVPEAESQSHLKGPWFLFNDFVVRNISEDEALSFASTWKVCVPFTHLILCFFTRDVRSLPCYISNEEMCALG